MDPYIFSSTVQLKLLDVPFDLDIIFKHLVAYTMIDSCNKKYLTLNIS